VCAGPMRLLVAGVAVQVSVTADGSHLREDPAGELVGGEPVNPILDGVDGSGVQWEKAMMCEDSAPQECKFTCEPYCPVGKCATRIGTCCNVQAPCKDTVHLVDAPICDSSPPQRTGTDCGTQKCHEGECAMRIDSFYRTQNDCEFQCQVPIGKTRATICPTSDDQSCKMECPPKVCADGQCAKRVGNCCEFKCASADDEEATASLQRLKEMANVHKANAEEEKKIQVEGLDCDGKDKDTNECQSMASMRDEHQAIADHIDAQIALSKSESALKSTMEAAAHRHRAWEEEQDAKAAKARQAGETADTAIDGVGRGLGGGYQGDDGYGSSPTASSTYSPELEWHNGKGERDAATPVLGPLYVPSPTDANDPDWQAGSGPTYRRRRRQIGGVETGHTVRDTGPRWDGTTGVDHDDRRLIAPPLEAPEKDGGPAQAPKKGEQKPKEVLGSDSGSDVDALEDDPSPQHDVPHKKGDTGHHDAPHKTGPVTSGEDSPAKDLPPPEPNAQSPAGQNAA